MTAADETSAPLPPLAVAGLFEPLLDELLGLVRNLEPANWERSASRSWSVRDVAAHLVDGDCRQLSFGRDRRPLLPPDRPIRRPEDLLGFLDGLNATWVAATKRLSARLLIELLELTGREVAKYFATLGSEDEAIFAVAWAGQRSSPNWLHLGRELTERWHHQQQIRRATGRPLLDDPRFARPVLEAFLYGVPPAYAKLEAPPGTAVEIRFADPLNAHYGISRHADSWQLTAASRAPAATIELDLEGAWLALTRSIPIAEARRRAQISGSPALTEPFFQACSIHKRPVD